jgi:hypothetical protein
MAFGSASMMASQHQQPQPQASPQNPVRFLTPYEVPKVNLMIFSIMQNTLTLFIFNGIMEKTLKNGNPLNEVIFRIDWGDGSDKQVVTKNLIESIPSSDELLDIQTLIHKYSYRRETKTTINVIFSTLPGLSLSISANVGPNVMDYPVTQSTLEMPISQPVKLVAFDTNTGLGLYAFNQTMLPSRVTNVDVAFNTGQGLSTQVVGNKENQILGKSKLGHAFLKYKFMQRFIVTNSPKFTVTYTLSNNDRKSIEFTNSHYNYLDPHSYNPPTIIPDDQVCLGDNNQKNAVCFRTFKMGSVDDSQMYFVTYIKSNRVNIHTNNTIVGYSTFPNNAIGVNHTSPIIVTTGNGLIDESNFDTIKIIIWTLDYDEHVSLVRVAYYLSPDVEMGFQEINIDDGNWLTDTSFCNKLRIELPDKSIGINTPNALMVLWKFDYNDFRMAISPTAQANSPISFHITHMSDAKYNQKVQRPSIVYKKPNSPNPDDLTMVGTMDLSNIP